MIFKRRVKVRYLGSPHPTWLYTYRDPFGVRVGDHVVVPTIFGYSRAVVESTHSFYLGRTKIIERVLPAELPKAALTPSSTMTGFTATFDGDPVEVERLLHVLMVEHAEVKKRAQRKIPYGDGSRFIYSEVPNITGTLSMRYETRP